MLDPHGDERRRELPHQNPYVGVAVVFTAGLVIGRAAGIGPWVWILLAVGAIMAWRGTEMWLPSAGRRRVASIGVACGILAAGAALWPVNQERVPAADAARVIQSERPVLLSCRLRIAGEPVRREASPDQPFFLAGPGLSCVGEIDELLTTQGWVPASGTVQVSIRGEVAVYAGQRVQIDGWARRPAAALNPGEFDYARFLAASRIFVTVAATRAGQVAVLDADGGKSWLETFRAAVRGKLTEYTLPRDEEAGRTLSALLLGQRDPQINSVGRAFADAGAAHLLAISGRHIVIVAGLVWLVGRALIRRPVWRTVVTVAVVLVYVAATPCGPPIVRAATATVLLAAARLSRRETSGLNMLAVALLVVLAFRPGDMVDAGLQLSFGCTAGLIVFGDRVHGAIFGKWLERRARIARAIGTPAARFFDVARRRLAEYLTANMIGAGVAAPLVAYHFHQANPLAVLSGIVLLPLVTATMIAGGLQILAASISSWLGALLAPVATGAAALMVWAVRVMAAIPGAVTALRAPPLWVVLGLYAALVLWAVRRRARVSRATVMVVGELAITVTLGWYVFTGKPATRLSMLAVGSGDCVVLQTPGGRTVVLDVGSARPHVAGRVVDPFLRSLGVNRVDALVMTGVELGQVSGVPELVDLYRPETVFCSGSDLRRRSYGIASTDLFARLARRGVRPVGLVAGMRYQVEPGAVCEALWPPDSALVGLSSRETGCILRVVCEGKSVLLVGADNAVGLGMVVESGAAVHADVVVVTGGRSPSAKVMEGLRTVSPRVVVCGGALPEVTPAMVVEERNLSVEGAMTVSGAGSGVEVHAFGGKGG